MRRLGESVSALEGPGKCRIASKSAWGLRSDTTSSLNRCIWRSARQLIPHRYKDYCIWPLL